MSKCPKIKQCSTSDTQITNIGNVRNKVNPTWKTCININGIIHDILYITPQNVVIKSIESTQIPEFTINNKICKIQIEKKYISCFLFICGEWYAIMRLIGHVLNVGPTALVSKNRAFFKLSNIIFNVGNTNINTTIIITNDNYSYNTNTTSQILGTSNSPTVQLKNCFEVVDDKNSVFNVLKRFRQQKVIANSVKNDIALNSTESLFKWVF